MLLVEDNERFAALLKQGLTAAGFVVDVLTTVKDSSAALDTGRWDIVVLDRGLPDGDGLDVLGDMRRRDDTTPVLILTAHGNLRDRVNGLQSGADDYLVKPFALEELVARLQALLRRPGNLLGLALRLGNLTLDTVGRQVFVDDRPITFSAREIAVLEHLLRRKRLESLSPAAWCEKQPRRPGREEVGSNAVEVATCGRRRRRFCRNRLLQGSSPRGAWRLAI